jgi:TRAP-type mannitol/chloroaromatic compound transport system substrate-binding protein
MEDAKALKKFEEGGTKIIKLSPQFIHELKKLADETYKEKAKKDPLFAKVYASQQAMLKEYGYWESLMVPPKYA